MHEVLYPETELTGKSPAVILCVLKLLAKWVCAYGRTRSHRKKLERRSAGRFSRHHSGDDGVSLPGRGLRHPAADCRIWNRLVHRHEHDLLLRQYAVCGRLAADGGLRPLSGAADVRDGQCPPRLLRPFHAGKVPGHRPGSPCFDLYPDGRDLFSGIHTGAAGGTSTSGSHCWTTFTGRLAVRWGTLWAGCLPSTPPAWILR